MKVICVDGSMIECEQFRALDEGVLLFDNPPEEDEEEGRLDAAGFIPHSSLRYVLPDSAFSEQSEQGEQSVGDLPQQQPTGQWGAEQTPAQQEHQQ